MFVNQQRRCGLECVGRRGEITKPPKKNTQSGVFLPPRGMRYKFRMPCVRTCVCVCEKSVGGLTYEVNPEEWGRRLISVSWTLC